jgi:thiamine monophosphate synthase
LHQESTKLRLNEERKLLNQQNLLNELESLLEEGILFIQFQPQLQLKRKILEELMKVVIIKN